MAGEEYPVLEEALDLEQAQIRVIQMCAPIYGERPGVSVEMIYSVDCRYKIPRWTLSRTPSTWRCWCLTTTQCSVPACTVR